MRKTGQSTSTFGSISLRKTNNKVCSFWDSHQGQGNGSRWLNTVQKQIREMKNLFKKNNHIGHMMGHRLRSLISEYQWTKDFLHGWFACLSEISKETTSKKPALKKAKMKKMNEYKLKLRKHGWLRWITSKCWALAEAEEYDLGTFSKHPGTKAAFDKDKLERELQTCTTQWRNWDI